ncbi:MAG: FixH family protein [Thioalkalivibrionaceae bacterium]
MDSLVISLGLGTALIVVLFLLIYRFTSLKGYSTAALVVGLTMLWFIPWSVLTWDGADVLAIHLALYIIAPYGLGIITSQLEARTRAGKPRIGRLHWFPLTLIAFFGVIATVNAAMITFANNGLPQGLVGVLIPAPESGAREVHSAFPGTVARITERKEALARTYIGRLELQETFGWDVRTGWVSRPSVGTPGRFQVTLNSVEDGLISNATVRGHFMYIASESQDQYFEMQPRGNGVYVADLALDAAGRWDLLLQVEHDGRLYEREGFTIVGDPTR